MRSPRQLLRLAVLRLLLAGVLYIALMFGWLLWSDGYATAFRAAGDFVFSKWYDGAEVHFVAQDVSGAVYAADRMQDTRLVLKNRTTRARGKQPVSSQYIGYVPTALFLALALPTPIRWRRRWRAVLLGLLLVNVFVLVRVWMMIFNALCSDTELALFFPSPFWRSGLAFATETLTKSLTTCFVVPLAIWVLVCFRRSDLAALRDPGLLNGDAPHRSTDSSMQLKRRGRNAPKRKHD